MATYTEFLGRPIALGPEFALHFAEADARRPFLTANDRMWRFFEPELRRRLSELDAQATMNERVHAALLEGLPSGEGRMPENARRLGMSARTLQRRLQAEGTSFQAVLNRTREALARHYLTRSDLAAAEFSFLLGFDDPNSFFRAFQSWTGTTPESLRSTAR